MVGSVKRSCFRSKFPVLTSLWLRRCGQVPAETPCGGIKHRRRAEGCPDPGGSSSRSAAWSRQDVRLRNEEAVPQSQSGKSGTEPNRTRLKWVEIQDVGRRVSRLHCDTGPGTDPPGKLLPRKDAGWGSALFMFIKVFIPGTSEYDAGCTLHFVRVVIIG